MFLFLPLSRSGVAFCLPVSGLPFCAFRFYLCLCFWRLYGAICAEISGGFNTVASWIRKHKYVLRFT